VGAAGFQFVGCLDDPSKQCTFVKEEALKIPGKYDLSWR